MSASPLFLFNSLLVTLTASAPDFTIAWRACRCAQHIPNPFCGPQPKFHPLTSIAPAPTLKIAAPRQAPLKAVMQDKDDAAAKFLTMAGERNAAITAIKAGIPDGGLNAPGNGQGWAQVAWPLSSVAPSSPSRATSHCARVTLSPLPSASLRAARALLQ